MASGGRAIAPNGRRTTRRRLSRKRYSRSKRRRRRAVSRWRRRRIDTPLVQITGARISAWKGERLSAVCQQTKEAYSAAAINRPLALLRHLLRLAHEEWEILPTVPKIKLEREPQGRLRWLTQDEIVSLLAACLKSRNPELRAAVIIAINTGLRRAELLGLTWDRVDQSRGVMRLEITKSGKRREIPLNDDSYSALLSLGPQ